MQVIDFDIEIPVLFIFLAGSPYCKDNSNGTDVAGDQLYRTINCQIESECNVDPVEGNYNICNQNNIFLFADSPGSIDLIGPRGIVFHGDNIDLVCRTGPSNPSNISLII